MFQDITNNEITLIENYVKNNLFDILKNEKCDNKEELCFFGPFSSKPQEFFILPDEKDQIFFLIDHVKKTIETKGHGHFTNAAAVTEECNLIESVLGPIFGQNQQHTFCELVRIDPDISLQSDVNYDITMLEPDKQKDSSEPISATHQLIAKLKETADQNILRKKTGYRFPDDVKGLAVYIRINAGKMVYETIHKNLELALPSLDTTNRIIRKMDDAVIEGCLRANELLKYLNERELPLVVTLSEDATGIEGRVQYDPKTNQVSGFTLPLNYENGMPIPLAYPARSGIEILNHFNNNNNTIARYVNVIMARPLADFPSFPLLIFSSDSKFKSQHVLNRWNFIVNELKKVNIKVLTVSSDSDPRYNSAMRRSSMIGQNSNVFNADWFCSGLNELFEGPFNFQDHLHILTKLRNLILRTLLNLGKLPIGKKFFVQIGHLQFLLDNFRKDEHQLTPSILNPVDKQNVGSAQRMCDYKVIRLLKEHLPRSEGTVAFLEIMRNIVDTFYDSTLTPLERIGKYWHSVFILRIWRDYIESQENLSIKYNFLSPASYICIEINAHSLVQLVIYLKNNNLDDWFMPFLFDSQACESFFREVRSLTTVHCRVANCSVKEIIGRMNKMQLVNDITNKSSFAFPRAQSKKDFANKTSHALPTKEEMFEQIEQSRCAAIEYAERIGLLDENVAPPNMVCKLPSLGINEKTQTQKEANSAKGPQKKFLNTLSQLRAVTLKNYSENIQDEIPESSPYVEIYNDGQKRVVVKKSSLCWLLREDPGKLSSDRIQRVQGIMKRRIKNKKKQGAKQQKKLIRRPKIVRVIRKKRN